jgi:DDE domain
MARSSTSLLQPRRDRHAAERFLRKLLRRSGRVPHRLVTDRLASYRAAHRSSCRPSSTTPAGARTIRPRSLPPTDRQRERYCAARDSPAIHGASRCRSQPIRRWAKLASRRPSATAAPSRVRYVRRRGSGLINVVGAEPPASAGRDGASLTVPRRVRLCLRSRLAVISKDGLFSAADDPTVDVVARRMCSARSRRRFPLMRRSRVVPGVPRPAARLWRMASTTRPR